MNFGGPERIQDEGVAAIAQVAGIIRGPSPDDRVRPALQHHQKTGADHEALRNAIERDAEPDGKRRALLLLDRSAQLWFAGHLGSGSKREGGFSQPVGRLLVALREEFREESYSLLDQILNSVIELGGELAQARELAGCLETGL